MTEAPNEYPQLRAAFDFGSGASKLAIAFVPNVTQPTRELDVLFEEEFELLIGISVSRSPNGAINDDIMRQLQALVAKLRDIVDRTLAEVAASRALNHLSLRMTAVCTAVYREASNGAQARDVIQNGLGVHSVRILTAAEEGHIGFLTGLIAARPQLAPSNDAREVAVYDSGGASFQITLGSGSDPSAARVIGCAEGNWGSGKAVHALLTRVQQKAAAKDHYVTCNPVSVEEAAKLRSLIEDALHHDGVLAAAPWLERAVSSATWIGIGGPTSAFRMCFLALGSSERNIRRDQLEAAINAHCALSDEALIARGFPQPEMVVAKMCLVLAVCTVLNLEQFTYYPTVGSTTGMFAYESLWIDDTQSSSPK
jgi:exopolyphosphatase/pppGpp-phosphohydrolase